MILHVGLSGLHLHLPHPSWRQVRHTLDTAAVVAACTGWACAAVTAVGLGYGRHLTAVLTAVVVAYAGYQFGARRATRILSARHNAAMVGVQRICEVERQESAARLTRYAQYAAADRETYASRKDRHVNTPYAREGASNERTGR
jgi:hypothetical protein